jgi:hypothetical protein
MAEKQTAAVLHADWKPRKGYTPTAEDTETRRATYASRVWHKPRVIVEDIPVPDMGPKDVQIKACGICGSDVHMYESDSEGYMLYPGLVKTPVVIGHELVRRRPGAHARRRHTPHDGRSDNKRTPPRYDERS